MTGSFADPESGLAEVSPVARARFAALRAEANVASVADDLFAPAEARLDDRLRAMMHDRLARIVAEIERELRLRAAQLLSDMGAGAAAETLLEGRPTLDRLARTGAFAEAALIAELIGSVRLAQLAETLPPGASAGAERASLVVRLAECPEPEVAKTANDLLIAANRSDEAASALPAELRRRLTWRIAAALRLSLGEEPRADHALAEAGEAALRIVPHEPVDAAAMRLAGAIAARPDELPGLLVETLGDRRPALFVALLAAASALDFAATREIVTDADGIRLWLLLRAQGLDRATIARIGVALAGADARRDLERFADDLDAVMAISAEDAAAVFAPLALPAEYRRALRDVERRA